MPNDELPPSAPPAASRAARPDWYWSAPYIAVLIFALVAAVGVFALIVNQLPSSRLWKRFVLKDQSTSKRGYVSAVEEPHLVGARGKVLTELRPSGSALIAGHPVDVVSEGAFIPKGELVQVVAVQGSRVVVRRVESENKTAGGIIIPDSAKEKPQEGEVVAVGTGKVLDNGQRASMDVKAGDKIIFSKYAGTEVKIDGKEYLIVSERDILAIVE